MDMCVCVCVCVYIYIRERERMLYQNIMGNANKQTKNAIETHTKRKTNPNTKLKMVIKLKRSPNNATNRSIHENSKESENADYDLGIKCQSSECSTEFSLLP